MFLLQKKSKNISKNVTITNDSNRLSKDQIEDMLAKAEKFKKEDEEIKKKIDAKNSLENLAFRYKSSVSEENIKSKLSQDEIKKVEEKCSEVINWLDKNQEASLSEFESMNKELDSVCQPIFAKTYGNGQQQQQQQNQPQDSNNGGPTIEVD